MYNSQQHAPAASHLSDWIIYQEWGPAQSPVTSTNQHVTRGMQQLTLFGCAHTVGVVRLSPLSGSTSSTYLYFYSMAAGRKKWSPRSSASDISVIYIRDNN